MSSYRFSSRLTLSGLLFLSSACLIHGSWNGKSKSSGSTSEGSGMRVTLDHRGFDPREPGTGDFLDCPASGPCDAVLIPRVESDEQVTLPRNKPVEELRFLNIKGFRAQGGDPILTLAIFETKNGDSVFADLNNDEDLGNDGPPRFWPKGDSCVTLDRAGGGLSPVTLCHAGPKAKTWRSRCEGMKNSIPWAMCGDGLYRLKVQDEVTGTITHDGKERRIGLCDLDGDGHFRLGGGDRVLLDWDGDGVLEKSLDGDGFAAPSGEHPFRFSADSATYEVLSADDDGGWLELKRLYAYDPAAVAFKAVEGRKAPDIRFVNLDGDTMRVSDFKGKKVLIQFWSTLCKPCLDGIADVREFQKAFGSKNWQIISLTVDSELSDVQQAVLKYHMDWMVGMAGPEARGYYATRPLPLNVKINADGVLEKKGVALGRRAF
jgi:thiol-disulfide isomerase/thioredoxin